MGRYSFIVEIAAPRELVFDLWANLDRMGEWIGGVSKITDVTGPTDQAGTQYVVWFGRLRSPTTVLEADRPSHLRTRFGNVMLRGENDAQFEDDGSVTRMTQVFNTVGMIPAIVARLLAMGSYRGSFRGELDVFKKIAEREENNRA